MSTPQAYKEEAVEGDEPSTSGRDPEEEAKWSAFDAMVESWLGGSKPKVEVSRCHVVYRFRGFCLRGAACQWYRWRNARCAVECNGAAAAAWNAATRPSGAPAATYLPVHVHRSRAMRRTRKRTTQSMCCVLAATRCGITGEA